MKPVLYLRLWKGLGHTFYIVSCDFSLEAIKTLHNEFTFLSMTFEKLTGTLDIHLGA